MNSPNVAVYLPSVAIEGMNVDCKFTILID